MIGRIVYCKLAVLQGSKWGDLFLCVPTVKEINNIITAMKSFACMVIISRNTL